MSHRSTFSTFLTLSGLAAASLLTLAAQPARAADLDYGYGGDAPPVAEERVEFGSGWYIRGDIGGTEGINSRAADDPYHGIYLGPGVSPPTLSTSKSKDLTYNASIGGGYQVNKWIRLDAVFDWHQPTTSSYQGAGRRCVTGQTLNADGVSETPVTAICTPTLAATLKSYDALINGYVDLPTFGIVTPYVGAGVGLSFGHASVSSTYYMNNGQPYNITYTDALNGATYKQYWDRRSGTQYYNLAFALMAGIAVDVYDHTKLDVGYRYLDLGKVLGTDLHTHEVRAGLRYMIDN